jgi:hypothetical protein
MQNQTSQITSFQNKIKNPFLFLLMLYKMLPLAAFTGVKMVDINTNKCTLSVKYKFLNKNPFKTTYWAVLGMCAEMSSGLLLLMHTYKLKPSVSTYVLSCEAQFVKRALGKTTFICEQGDEIVALIQQAIQSNEAQQMNCKTIAYNQEGEVVAIFNFVWGIKVRNK